ncbi:MAG: hypothetical protein mread185_000549 [Mycoplasmataceae bacterium]|nr:MAG: hypothetical protein mread185_000549 [Mycoplasmataceae bacterium]
MTFIAFGKNTVENLLQSPYFSFKKVILKEEHHNNKKLLKILEKKTNSLSIIRQGWVFSL